MTNRGLVSIVVPCYNSAKYLRSALDSVLNQTYEHIECLVVDDGSTDGTKDLVLEYLEKDKRVKYFFKENGGEASAKNYGLERSSGEWVHVLDSDDWIASDKIANQIEAGSRHRNDDNYVIAYSDFGIVYENGSDNETYPADAQVIVGKLSKGDILHRIVSRKTGLATPTPITLNSMLLSRNIFDKYKMNEDMPNIADLELYYRILQEDVVCIYVPGISMYYRQHGSNVSKDSRRSLVGYAMFLSTIHRVNKDDLRSFPNLHRMLQRSITQKEDAVFRTLVYLLGNSEIPVYTSWLGQDVNVRALYRLLARVKLLRSWVKGEAVLNGVKRRLVRAVKR